MKIVPYLFVAILIVWLSVNVYLLSHPVFQKKYIDRANIATGIFLWINFIVLVAGKHRLKKSRGNFGYKIFSNKNG